ASTPNVSTDSPRRCAPGTPTHAPSPSATAPPPCPSGIWTRASCSGPRPRGDDGAVAFGHHRYRHLHDPAVVGEQPVDLVLHVRALGVDGPAEAVAWHVVQFLAPLHVSRGEPFPVGHHLVRHRLTRPAVHAHDPPHAA